MLSPGHAGSADVILEVEVTRAVTDALGIEPESMQYGEKRVRHRRAIRTEHMSGPFQLPVGMSGEEQWHPEMVVHAAVAHRAAIENDGMIEKIAIAIRHLTQSADEVLNLIDVERIQFGKLGELLWPVPMVRERMEWCLDTSLGKDTGTDIAPHLKRRYPRQLGRERQHLQVEHQPHVLAPAIRHPNRSSWEISRDGCCIRFLKLLYPTFDLAHVLKIVAEARTIGCAKTETKIVDLVNDGIKNACIFQTSRSALTRRRSITKQALERHPWVAFHR